MNKPANIDAYVASFSTDIQAPLQELRELIKRVAPEATEAISYGMPAFKLYGGMLVWFAAHTHHIGLYPRVSAMEKFKKELSGYKSAKGSVQFPLDKPLPLDLIAEIVKFRAGENLQRAKKK